MNDIEVSIANVLRGLRIKKGLSQEKLSFDSGLHRTYISQLERGKKAVTVKSLLKITDALDIEIDEFMKLVKNEYKKI